MQRPCASLSCRSSWSVRVRCNCKRERNDKKARGRGKDPIRGTVARAGNGYPALDGANNRPGFCYDTALLLPEFNPMAVPLPEASWTGNGGLVASPLSTVLVFAASSGESYRTRCFSEPRHPLGWFGPGLIVLRPSCTEYTG